jgi:hypothetical protein
VTQSTSKPAHFFVKQRGDSPLSGPLSLERESVIRETLFDRGLAGGLLQFVPKLLHNSVDALVFEGIPDSLSVADQISRKLFQVGTARSMASLAAALHLVPTHELDKKLAKLQCPVMTFGRLTPDDLANKIGLNENFLRLIGISPTLNATLRAACKAWSTTSVIHGDFQADNVLSSTNGHERLHLVDWELCGIGDPNWDLGALIGSFYYCFLLTNDQSPLAMTGPGDWTRSFLREYTAMAPQCFDELKCFSYAAAWLVMKTQINIAVNLRPSKLDVRAIYVAASMIGDEAPRH